MPTAAPLEILTICTAPDNWYVNFPNVKDPDHNNHLVVAWALCSDNMTVVPLITDPTNQMNIIQAGTIFSNYILLNPYSQCPSCVRPLPPAH
jgi:hypothetical protein